MLTVLSVIILVNIQSCGVTKNRIESWNHRITEWLVLEETLNIILFQLLLVGSCQESDLIAQGTI